MTSNKDFIIGMFLIIIEICLAILFCFYLLSGIKTAEDAHKGQEFVCVEYGKRVVTRERIFSITTTYDTYEEEYCKNYEWRDIEE